MPFPVGGRWPRRPASISPPKSSVFSLPMRPDDVPVNLSEIVGFACMWEVSARKAGNVHPQRSFSDLRVDDFLQSAQAIAPLFADAERGGVGGLVLSAIQATRRVVHTNTNLGIVLLLAPLAV